ncbi:hypothetical protein PLESTB_001419100 [Pleodorina starrii]|uniref:Protein kinase domain-containing protein n=1 Tax=Pleodorina starrii TaxID=330485 RepID=A0A9W6F7R8_9CHLO|nr:hypothetical protein PLESTB_001419100 [Pleodorina starrii]GLC65096.1 hypothetical protein PLESTF_000246200 [Pleodorina starrii]
MVLIALFGPLDGPGEALPYASVVCSGGPYGALLQQHQQLGHRAAVVWAARSADEPFTSSHRLLSGVHGDILLLSREASTSAEFGDGVYSASGGGTDHLPTDWAAAAAAASPLRHFCGLPLRVGQQLVAVITLAWSANCAVPPGLRPRCAAATAGGSGTPAAAAAPPPPSEAERACLLQLSQIFSLGLFGDPSSVVYGQKVARMLHVMTQAMTLQAALDGLMAGVREVLLHRCQQDLAVTLALKHTSAPTAAFIPEGRSASLLLSPAAAPLSALQQQRRSNTASGHVTAAAAAVQARSGGGGGGGGGETPRGSVSGQARAGAPGTVASHPPLSYRPNTASPVAAGVAAAGLSAPGFPFGRPNINSQNSCSVGAAAKNTPANTNSNPSMNFSSGGGGGGLAAAAAAAAAKVAAAAGGNANLSALYRRMPSGEARGGTGGGSGTGGGGGASMSRVLRHAMSVELGMSMDADCAVPSTVHAHITSAAHTLLMASLIATDPEPTDEPPATVAAAGGIRYASNTSCASDPHSAAAARREIRAYLALQGRVTGGAGAGAGAGRGTGPSASGSGYGPPGGGGGGAGGSGPGVVRPQGCIIQNCHLHLQDESLPCRDLVLVQKLTRMPVQSLVLVVVRSSDVPLPPPAVATGHRLPYAHASTASVSPSASQAGPGAPTGAAACGGTGEDPASQCHAANAAALSAAAMTSVGLYLSSPDPVTKAALAGVMAEAREAVRLALGALYRHVVTHGSLTEEWNGLLEALVAANGSARLSYGSSRMVSLLRPRSSANVMQEQASGEFVSCGIMNSPSRGHLGTSPGMLSTELSKPLASGRIVLDASVEQPLQQLDAMISSIQSTLSAVQLQLDVPGGGGRDTQEVRLNDIAAVELLEIIGRGGQGVVFRGVVHGVEAAIKVISHRDDAEEAATAGGGGGGGGGADKRAGGGEGSTRAGQAGGGGGAAASAALDSPMCFVDEARMRERKRNLLRDALELAVTSTISHPNVVQMYGYFTDCVVVQYANQANRLKLLPADSEALQQYGGQRGPVNTVMCMEFCDAGTLKSAAEAGAFRLPGVSAKSGPACPSLVPLYIPLLELALALRHLHGRRLVHCDLKPSNVLLKSSLRDPRGWICKLSDFGCVRVMNEEGVEGRLGFRQPQPLGTVTHMAPEMFVRGGLLDGGVDIYAFGIIMWELIMVAPLYDGTVPKEKLPSMIRRGLRPTFHPLVPSEYRMLATACWQEDPRRRPTAAVLVSMLQRLLSRAQAASVNGSSFSVGGGSGSGGSGGGGVKAMSSSFSGIGRGAAAAGGGGGPAPPAEADAAAQQRRVYGGVPRRNTVASNLGLGLEAAGSVGGATASAAAASGQRQAFPPPVSSPLSREAGPAARAAVRVGDGGGGGGAKPPTRLAESSMMPMMTSHGGGSANAATLSPLGTGLGPAAPPSGRNVSAIEAAAAAAAAAAARSSADGGPIDDPALPSVPAAAGSAAAAAAVTAAASSLLGIGNASAAGRSPTPSSGGAAAAAAAVAAAAAAAGGGGGGGAHGSIDTSVVLPVRGNVFATGSVGPLSTSTVIAAANTGELMGL